MIASPSAAESALLTVRQVATICGCSPQTVYRLSSDEKMPPPVRLGTLVRWSRLAVEDWIAAGCPACQRSQEPGETA